MVNDNVVYIKVFDEEEGDVVFEGDLSTEVTPDELLHLGCFLKRRLGFSLGFMYNRATCERVASFRWLRNSELVFSRGGYSILSFSGVLYVGCQDGALRKSNTVPSCECLMMTVFHLSHEECKKAFKCETLEELEIK